MKHFKTHHPKIIKNLQAGLSTDKKTKFKDLKKYIGTQYDFIGLSSPRQRLVFQTGHDFGHLSLSEQLNIWNSIWLHSNSFEALSQCLYFVSKHLNEFNRPELWKVTKGWTGKIDNWAHSDGLSAIYSYLLEVNAKEVYTQFKIWNHSSNPWERRQSVVGLLEYSKKRNKILPVSKLLPLVKSLLTDENYFVQKGIGWTLREIGNVYPEETWDFLLKHSGVISAVAFSPAVEKLSVKRKEELKALRKRKKSILPSKEIP
jgi:3-methyladenine DNA glycosylase AlkD